MDENQQMTPPENINARFKEVWDAIDFIREKKQNRVSSVIWAPLIVWLLTTTIGGVWWAATLSANMKALTTIVSSATDDRYRSADAVKDFALRDKDIQNNNESIKDMKASILRIENGVRDIRQRVIQ